MTLHRRHFLAGLATVLAAQPRRESCLMIQAGQLERMRPAASNRSASLENLASAALKAGPWSVTYHRPTGLNLAATEHDYFSEGPYWWPDPKNPTGPYIRKDGQRNPARFQSNHNDMGNLCEATLSLGMGASLLGQSGCSEHAAQLLSTWFIDPKTRMNPNLEFGQAVRGLNTGRGTGLIDTVGFIHLVQGVMLLEAAGNFDPSVAAGVRDWFHQFATWMTTSQKGLDEKKSGNNHATWWTAQVAAYAIFTRDTAMESMAWDNYRQYLVPEEIKPNGSCPKEEARTNSLDYSVFNLDAFSVICRLAQVSGIDLWHYRAPSGASVQKAVEYMIPYVANPSTWTKQEIGDFNPAGHFFPGLAAIGLNSSAMIENFRKLARNKSSWIQFVDLVVGTYA